MKKISFVALSIILLVVLTACSSNHRPSGEKDFFSYQDLLSPNKGTYSLYIVGKHLNPQFLEKNNFSNVREIRSTSSLKAANEDYPELELKKSPVFIVFDHKGIVFKTHDYQKFVQFLKEIK